MKWPFSKTINETKMIDIKPSMYFGSSVVNKLTEQFKGEIEQNKVKFPAELGEEHPFNFDDIEKLYKKFGLFSAIVDKYIDFIVGPGFYVTCDDDRAKKIIEEFIQDINLDTILRQWIKEALIKGNGFLELGGSIKEGIEGVKILNANWMYVLRDKLGKIEGYNQYVGGFDKFTKKKINNFRTEQIAHLPFNVIGDCAYGYGIGYTAMMFIDNWLKQNNSMHKLSDRKANAPLHAKFGYINGETKIIPKPEEVQAFGRDLETMDNKTEWVTDPLVDLKVIDFGNFGEKFAQILENDLDMLIYAFQVPAVLLGKANIPEGLAKVQMEAFQRRIQSMQAEIEKVIESKIFKRVLNANGFDVHVEFEWGTPSIMETEGRMKLISELMRSLSNSGAFSSLLEEEMVNLLKLDKDEYEKMKLEEEQKMEEERNRLETQAQPQVPGQNKNFPQKPLPKLEQPKQPKPEEMMKDILENLFKAMQLQEEKRNELMLKQQQQLSEEQKKRMEQDSEFVKQLLQQMKEMNELKLKEETKNKVVEVEQKIEVKSKQKLMKRTSLLPNFKITRKTESAPEIDTIAKPESVENLREDIKKIRIKKNYEYEKECKHCQESWDNFNTIEEWTGFNYKKYLAEIINVLNGYDFNQIHAITEAELEAGYLSDEQVIKLRGILENGFKNGKSIRDMAKEVDKKLNLHDLYRMTDDGNIKTGASGLPILAKTAEKRSIGIIRSEVTRAANAGAVEFYKQNDIQQVSWIASFGDRTCLECESLNGQIFEINKHPEIPLHPLCRCTLSPVVELK